MAYALGGESAYYQPPEPVLCEWCDGAAWVDVASITDAGGGVHQLDEDSPYHRQHEIRCPRCSGTGEEPKPEGFVC